MLWAWQGARGNWSIACIKTAVISLRRLLYESNFRWPTGIVVLKRFLRVPWTARKINQSIRKDINLEYSLEGTDAKAEAPILWPPDAKSWLTEKKNKTKNPDAGKDWGQEEKRATEDEMVGWFPGNSWQEFERSPGDGEGQGSHGWLQFTGLPRVARDLMTEHQSIDWIFTCPSIFVLFNNQTLANIRKGFHVIQDCYKHRSDI